MASVHEIPPNIQSIDELRLAINDRLRRLAGGGSLQITGDLNMQGHRLLNVGAPGGLNDGATLADVRRAASRPTAAAAVNVADFLDDLEAGIAYPDRS